MKKKNMSYIVSLAITAATLFAGFAGHGAITVDDYTILYVSCDKDYGFGTNEATAADKLEQTQGKGDRLQTESKVADEICNGVYGPTTANPGYLYGTDIAVQWKGAETYAEGDFTFECFIKTDTASSALSGKYFIHHPGAWMIQLNGSGQPALKTGGWRALVTPPAINDGIWHHLAVVQDRARGMFSYYIDYKLVGEAEYTVTKPENNSNYQYFRINNYEPNGPYNFNLSPPNVAYDEVRLTKRALTPKEFITTSSVAQETIAHDRKLEAMAQNSTIVYASCDGEVPSDNNVNELCSDNEELPRLVVKMNDRASSVIDSDTVATVYPDASFEASGHPDSGALGFVGNGRLIMSDTSYLDDDFTLEFFFKCAEPGNLGTGNNDPDGYLAHQNECFYVRMNRDGSVSFDEKMVAGLGDGKFHHYAIVYSKTSLKLGYYLDGRRVWGKTLEKALSESKTSDPLYLGAGSWGSGAYHCVKDSSYDEIRLTRKVLNATEFIATTRHPVFKETKAYLSFDNTLDPSSVSPALGLDCQYYTTKVSEQTSDGVIPSYYAAARETVAYPNENAFHVDIEQEDNGNTGGGYIFSDPDYAFSTGSWTAETFFKVEGSTKWYGYIFNCDQSWSVCLSNNGGNKLIANVANHGDVFGTENLADGKYHHLAVVADDSSQTISFYLDHALFARYENVTDPLKDGATRSEALFFGCRQKQTYGVGGGLSNAWYDGLRLTKRALKVTEFMTTEALAADATRLDVRFEEDWNSSAAGKYAISGTVPETGVLRKSPGRSLWAICNSAGNVIRETNCACARLTGGTIAYSGNGALDEKMATFEAFVKKTNGGADDAVVTMNCGLAMQKTLWRLTADGVLHIDGTDAFPAVELDDNWHHIAVSWNLSEEGFAVSLFYDHELAAKRVLSQAFEFEMGSSIVLGSAGFNGAIDEMRLSPEVLETKDHLYAVEVRALSIVIR